MLNSENSDSEKYKWRDFDIPAFDYYGVFMTSDKDFKPKVNSNSLSVYTELESRLAWQETRWTCNWRPD